MYCRGFFLIAIVTTISRGMPLQLHDVNRALVYHFGSISEASSSFPITPLLR